ncbi:hypothetical protein GCM10027586_09210 [Kineococcus gypseus]|uniref:hypothetical protein n=1 Tax=Kineococcus gypseus TaxID=1637102 RepID=UPI003D7DF024
MGRTQVSLHSVVAGAVLAVALAGCGEGGDLAFHNDGPDDVSVVSDGETSTVHADGGMVVLDAGCTDGDVLVTFPSGKTVTVPGPVCPDQEVVIHDQEVELRTRADG